MDRKELEMIQRLNTANTQKQELLKKKEEKTRRIKVLKFSGKSEKNGGRREKSHETSAEKRI